MKVLIAFLCSIMISSLLNAQDEAELVKKVKAKLDKVNDYQANGKMKIDVPFINAPESDVIIYFKKPDKYKVKKTGGISILPKGGVSVNTNTLLMNDHYEVVPAKSTDLNGTIVKVVKLLPTDENSDVVLTTLYIDDKNLVIRKASVTTKENGSYDIELDYGKFINWGLPDKVAFSFNTKDYKLPKGITFDYDKGEQKKDKAIKNKKGKVEITYSNYSINKGISDEVFKS
jgi:outer membrane lipoprotein-sorting protein